MANGGFNIDYLGWGRLGAGVGFVFSLIAMALNQIGGLNVQFTTVSVAGQREAVGEIGKTLLDAVNVSTGSMVTTILTLVVAFAAIAIVGRLIYSFVPIGRTPTTKLAAIFASGHLVLSYFVIKAGVPAVTTFVALGLMAYIAALVAVQLSKATPIKLPQN